MKVSEQRMKFREGEILLQRPYNLVQVEKYEQISEKFFQKRPSVHKDMKKMALPYFCKDVKGLNNKTKLIN